MKIITEQHVFQKFATDKVCVFVHPQHDGIRESMVWANKLQIPLEQYNNAEYLMYEFDDVSKALEFSEQFNKDEENFYSCTFVNGKVLD